MKLSVNRVALLNACKQAKEALAKRTTHPSLRCFRLECREGLLNVQATNIDVAVSIFIGCTIDAPGACLIDGEKLISILSRSSEIDVTIEVGDGAVAVNAGAVCRLPEMDANTFPFIPEVKTIATVKVTDVPRFVQQLKRVSFSVDDDGNTRYATRGVSIKVCESELEIAATDTIQLALAAVACDSGDCEPGSQVIVPDEFAALVCAAGDKAESASMELAKTSVRYTIDNTTIYTRQVEGKFPPYAQFMPKSLPVKMTVDRDPLLAAIRQAEVVTEKESTSVTFNIENNLITIRANTSLGDAVATCPCQYDDDPITVRMCAKKLIDYLRRVEGTLNVIMPKDAARVLFNSPDGMRFLLMPLVIS